MHTHCFVPQPSLLSARSATVSTKRKPKEIDYGAIPAGTDAIHAWLSQAALDLALKPAKHGH